MSEAIALIKDIGFPIFVAVYLLLQQKDLKNVIKQNTEALTKFCEKTQIKTEQK